jgi:hypothetical protein
LEQAASSTPPKAAEQPLVDSVEIANIHGPLVSVETSIEAEINDRLTSIETLIRRLT